MINEKMKFKGSLDIHMNGKLIKHIPNKVVAVGRDWVVNRMEDNYTTGTSAAKSPMTHMAVGTRDWAADGLTEVPDGDYELASEISNANGGRQPVTITTPTVNSRLVLQFVANFDAGDATGALTEAGVFNSGTTDEGTMLCYTKFDAINKGSEDTLQITWRIQIS